MSILTPIPRHTPWYARILLSIPLIGWMARDVLFGDKDNIWYALVAVLSVWVIAIVQIGILALYLPMVMLTPVCFVMLILLTRG